MKSTLIVAVAALLAAADLAAQGADSKIAPELMSAFSGGPGAGAPFFVLLKARADLTAASRIADRAARGSAVVQALQSTAFASQAALVAQLQRLGVPFVPYWVQNAVYVPHGTLGLARTLAQRPEVAAIVPEPIFSISEVESAASLGGEGVEWNIAKIRADQAWLVTRGDGIVVATIDSGARFTHEALVRRYRGNLGTGFDHEGNWYDATTSNSPEPYDNTDHGTHVLGAMVGDDGGSRRIGVAPEGRWIACKGCASNTLCEGAALMACAQWVMDPLADGSGANQPDIVNNSWSGSGGNSWFMSFVASWRAAGIFPAFAAGNKGPVCGSAGSPGDYPESFAAGATDANDAVASFSARGPSVWGGIKPDVTAPGVYVVSSIATGDASYAVMSGTSMASPHVAGTVALMWAANQALRGNVAQTEVLLRQTAVGYKNKVDCGGTARQIPNNTYGYGRIDALAAVMGALPANEPPVVSISSPSPGASFACPATVEFTAAASDPEDGDLTVAINWSEGGVSFGMGGTASKSYSCDEAGSRSVLASVTDNGGLTGTDAVTIQIVGVCKPIGDSCTSNAQCCSAKCAGKVCK